MKKLEEYWPRGGLVEEKLERFVINIGFSSSDEDSDAGNSAAKDRNCVKQVTCIDTMDEGSENVSSISRFRPLQ